MKNIKSLLLTITLLGLSLVVIVSANTIESSSWPTTQQLLQNASPRSTTLTWQDYQKKLATTNTPVLGYVTPWNPRGKELVERFRNKFDLVSPVWYTIHTKPVSNNPQQGPNEYQLSGAPTSTEDEEWYLRLQKSNTHSNPFVDDGFPIQSKPVKVVPRFMLDGWTETDFYDLLSNQTQWKTLADLIMKEVQVRGYDGIVLESAATYLLHEPISILSQSLHSHNKTLVLVLPPLRTSTLLGVEPSSIFESQNTMILQAIPSLAKIVDYFSIMTYDMTDAGGIPADLVGSDFPIDSPLRQAKKGSLRRPGPNTHPKWLQENLSKLVVHPANPSNNNNNKVDRFQNEQDELNRIEANQQIPFQDEFNFESLESETVLESHSVDTRKFLMGLPMYGYKYPLFWLDKRTGQGVARQPPTTSNQTVSDAIPLLRGPGEPIGFPAILELLNEYNPFLLLDQDSAESYFDYEETVTEQGRSQGYGVRPGDKVYWRAYIPTRRAMQERIKAIQDSVDGGSVGGGGISLWEVGQAGKELLVDL